MCITVPGSHRTSMKPTSYCSSAHRRGNTRRLYHTSFWRCHDSARRPPRWKWRWHSCWLQRSYTGNPRWKRTPKETVLILKYSSQWRNQESKAIRLEFTYPYSFLIEPSGQWWLIVGLSPQARSLWDLWWMKLHWDKFHSKYFFFPLSVPLSRCYMLVNGGPR